VLADLMVIDYLYFKELLCAFITRLVKDIFPGTFGSSPEGFTSFNNRLFFSASMATLAIRMGANCGSPMARLLELNW
jgi:hypothetical protein